MPLTGKCPCMVALREVLHTADHALVTHRALGSRWALRSTIPACVARVTYRAGRDHAPDRLDCQLIGNSPRRRAWCGVTSGSPHSLAPPRPTLLPPLYRLS